MDEIERDEIKRMGNMVTSIASIYRSYEELLSGVDQEFNRVRNIFSERMNCRSGCGSCCSQLFPISVVEAAYISRAVKQLEPQAALLMRDSARAYLKELTGAAVEEAEGIEAHSASVEAALNRLAGRRHIPCPALKDDACTIYSHRPVMARKWGIPLWNPKNPKSLQACELNFKPGEVIEVDGLVEPQIKLEYQWLEFKTRIQEELDVPKLVATVASAIVFDYEDYLENKIGRRPSAY